MLFRSSFDEFIPLAFTGQHDRGAVLPGPELMRDHPIPRDVVLLAEVRDQGSSVIERLLIVAIGVHANLNSNALVIRGCPGVPASHIIVIRLDDDFIVHLVVPGRLTAIPGGLQACVSVRISTTAPISCFVDRNVLASVAPPRCAG